MAFEDDMIEAGYSDEQDYLDSLFDDFEENYRRQQDRELEYDDDYDSSDYEEEERERRERQLRREAEKQWVNDWKEKNTDIAIIWQSYFCNISNLNSISNMDNRHYMGLNEHKELKKWLNEREHFENERQKENWLANLQVLFSMYKNELFKFYFPVDEERINMSIVSQQARELSSIEFYEPSLWKTVCSSYSVDAKLFKGIEWVTFWSEVYRREMDYEYWKDNNIEKYNEFAKRWIADSASYWSVDFCVYGDWLKKHEAEEIEWKHKNQDLWNKFKRNYEIREKNKYIEEYMNKSKNGDTIIEDDWDEIERYLYLDDRKSEPFLPDLECSEEIPYDISSLNKEQQDSICSLDMSNIYIESSKYADKVMSQLWIYNNRDEWEMDALKEHHKNLFKYEHKYSQELLNWWKVKYPNEWDNFVKTIVPLFKNKFEVVMKFRLWALDGHKDEFISLGDKYLLYWIKTLKFMYGEDIDKQLLHNYFFASYHQNYYWGEDIDYIKKNPITNQDIEIWQKELRDKVIWDSIYNKNYEEHYFIDSMYTSLWILGHEIKSK